MRRIDVEAAEGALIGIPRSTVTQVIKQLEERLGVRLLQRALLGQRIADGLAGEVSTKSIAAIVDEEFAGEGRS